MNFLRVVRRAKVPYSSAYRTLFLLFGVGPRQLAHMDSSAVPAINGTALETVVAASLALARRGLAYFTLPPAVPWPWLLVHVKAVDALEPVLRSMRPARPAEVVLDVGVMEFFDRKRSRYTNDFWRAFWEAINVVHGLRKRYGFSWRVVLPDVPATVEDNVHLTMRLQEEVLGQWPDLPWIPVAQASTATPHAEHMRWLVETGVVARYGVVALGSLKVLAGRRKRAWLEAVDRARRLLEEHGLGWVRLHVFGAPLNIMASPRLPPGSWDSKTWTFPRVPHMWSSKSASERLQFWLAYLSRLLELLERGCTQTTTPA